jgi:hypothetical protein
MLKRSTSLIATLAAVVALVSAVTLLEVRAAARMNTTYTTSDTQVFTYDLGYLAAPAGVASDIPPGYYWQRITAVEGAPTAYVEVISYSGTVVSAGPVDATHEYATYGDTSQGTMQVAMMTTSTASPSSPSPSPTASSSPSPSPSASPSPSPSPSPPPSPRPGSITISDTGIGISYNNGRITGTITIPWKGCPSGMITIGWSF